MAVTCYRQIPKLKYLYLVGVSLLPICSRRVSDHFPQVWWVCCRSVKNPHYSVVTAWPWLSLGVWVSAVPVCHSCIRTFLWSSCIYSWLYSNTLGWDSFHTLAVSLSCVLLFVVYVVVAVLVKQRIGWLCEPWPWLCCIMCRLCCCLTGLQAGWHTVSPLWSCALLAFCNRLSDWCCTIWLLMERGWKGVTVLLVLIETELLSCTRPLHSKDEWRHALHINKQEENDWLHQHCIIKQRRDSEERENISALWRMHFILQSSRHTIGRHQMGCGKGLKKLLFACENTVFEKSSTRLPKHNLIQDIKLRQKS